MDFLFQFQVKAKDVFYKDPIEFKLDGIGLTLYLDDKDWISKGQKAHFTVTAGSKNEAYGLIWKKIGDFNNRLVFLSGESIIISHLEFFIFDQTGEEVRDIFFRDIKLPGKHELNYRRIAQHSEFMNQEILEVHKSAMQYFNQAVLSESDHEQFKSLYLALEQLAGSELVEAKCDRQDCGGVLICSNCKKTKEYPRVTIKRLQEFMDSTNYSQKFEAINLSAKDLTKMRAQLSHAVTKGNKTQPFAINDVNHSLSLLIRWYLEEQYRIWPGGSVVRSGLVAADERQFRTNNPQEKLALDIPPLNELKEHSPNTRWIIS